MQWVPIILARNTSVISRLIRFFTKDHVRDESFSHVGIIDGMLVLESRGEVGCVATPIEDFRKRYSYYELAYIPVVSKRKAYTVAWEHINKKTPHDKHRSFGFIMKFLGLGRVKDFEHTDKLDCAEFVQASSGWLTKVHDISPNFLASISEKKPIAN